MIGMRASTNLCDQNEIFETDDSQCQFFYSTLGLSGLVLLPNLKVG